MLLLLTLSVASVTFAQSGMTHGTAPAGGAAAGNHAMHSPSLNTLTGPAFDRAFLSMMIAHHRGAVDMSQRVLNTVRDAQVKAWTADIIRAQRREMADMTAWLGTLGGVDAAAQTEMTTEMEGMMATLKSSADSDVGLVRGMLPHHASAIAMASVALQKSRDARVLTLARSIIRTQADEMYAYRQWLIKRGL